MAALKLRTLLGDHAVTAALKQRSITSPIVDFDFADVKVPNTAFKRVVRDLEFDVAELAIVTFLMAKDRGVPLTLLPAVLMARFQHPFILTVAGRAITSPRNLEGCRIGIRSYTVTTVVWIRAILANDYGVDLDKISWVTFENAHVAGFDDPPNAVRANANQDLKAMLLAGEIDAAIMPGAIDDPRIIPLIPDAATAAAGWHEKHGAIQINHMVAVKSSLAVQNPKAAKEIYRMLLASKDAAGLPQPGTIDLHPFGIEPNRRNLEVAIEATYAQGLVSRRLEVDELFDDAIRGSA
jgi:4,5-dihydroxyphthalate decarboxylase